MEVFNRSNHDRTVVGSLPFTGGGLASTIERGRTIYVDGVWAKSWATASGFRRVRSNQRLGVELEIPIYV